MIKSHAVLSSVHYNKAFGSEARKKKMRSIITRGIVEQFVEMLTPTIQWWLRHFDRPSFHLVVLNPTNLAEPFFDAPLMGRVEDYKRPYDKIAMGKAQLSGRTGRDTGEILARYPMMLRPGDVIYQGGVNYFGLPIGGSGGPAPVDEGIVRMVGAVIHADCQMRVADIQQHALTTGGYTIPHI